MDTVDPTQGPAPDQSQHDYDLEHGAIPAQLGPLQSTPPAAPLAPAGQQLPAELANTPAGALAQDPPVQEDRQVSHNEPILTQGASGDSVVKLCKLLAHAGFANNNVVRAESPANVLDQTVMADVERFWAAYPDATEPDELYAGREGALQDLQGKWVGPHTWQKLYELAGVTGA